MRPRQIPRTDHSAAPVSPLQLRRAVLAVLLDAVAPMRLDEVAAALLQDHRIDLALQWSGHDSLRTLEQRLSDLLRWQVRAGRVYRVSRSTFVVAPGAMSLSTQWRCRNWRRIGEDEVRGR